LQLYSVKGKMNYVNTATDVLKEFRDGKNTERAWFRINGCMLYNGRAMMSFRPFVHV